MEPAFIQSWCPVHLVEIHFVKGGSSPPSAVLLPKSLVNSKCTRSCVHMQKKRVLTNAKGKAPPYHYPEVDQGKGKIQPHSADPIVSGPRPVEVTKQQRLAQCVNAAASQLDEGVCVSRRILDWRVSLTLLRVPVPVPFSFD